MPRTVTGTYTLRPTSFNSYLSSGTFSDYFDNNSAPSSGWYASMAPGTSIGDNSDSTYFNYGTVGTSSNTGKNAIMNMTVTSGTVPSEQYTVTSINLYFRTKASAQTGPRRVVDLYNTLWYGNGSLASTPNSRISNGFFGVKTSWLSSDSPTCETSTTTKSTSVTVPTNKTLPAGKFPDYMAICISAYRTSTLYALSNVYLYDVWWTIEYSYTENEVPMQWANDEGVSVSVGGTTMSSYQTYSEYKGTQYVLSATVRSGYIFDGYYLNGQKVSSTTSYTYTFNGVDRLYCITKKRMIYIGTYQVEEVYIGNIPAKSVYNGTTKIWGDSDLYEDATDPVGSVG